MKKIKMILTNRYDPDVRVYKEAKYLLSKGFDVEILCWDREGEYRDREVEETEGIKIRRFFPYARYGSGLKQLKAFYQFMLEIKTYLKSNQYDIIHCHDLDGILAGYLARSSKVPLVFDMHEIYEVQGNKQKIRYIVRNIVNFTQSISDYIIYVNELQAKYMKESNKKKLVYLPNYPDIENYVGCEKNSLEELRVSYIGAVRQYNELKNLMDACKDMRNVRVAIHGAGVAYKSLSQLQHYYENVEVTGVYNVSQSADLYSKADVLYAIYPMNTVQNRIAYPVKFFEAIITKTPIIVSRGSILEEFLKKHDIGFVVDGSNTEEVKHLIANIANNKSLLVEKTKQLEKIQYDYSWNEIVRNLDKIYD